MNVDQGAAVTPEGWYPDPRHPDQDRWWAGSGWTDRTRPALREDAAGTVVRPAGAEVGRPVPGDPPTAPVPQVPVPAAGNPPAVTAVQPVVPAPPWTGPPTTGGGPAVAPPVPTVDPVRPPAAGRAGVPIAFLVAVTALVAVVAVGVAYLLGRTSTSSDSAAPGDAVTTTTSTAEPGPSVVTSTPPATAPPLAGPMVRPASVSRTCGSGGRGDCFVSVRTGPTSVAPEVARLSEGGAASVLCQVDGESVRSSVLGRPTSVWWRDTDGHYVSAAFLDVDGADPFTVGTPC